MKPKSNAYFGHFLFIKPYKYEKTERKSNKPTNQPGSSKLHFPQGHQPIYTWMSDPNQDQLWWFFWLHRKQSPDLTNLIVSQLNNDVATRYSEYASDMTHLQGAQWPKPSAAAWALWCLLLILAAGPLCLQDTLNPSQHRSWSCGEQCQTTAEALGCATWILLITHTCTPTHLLLQKPNAK